jgi:hypothetical protein
MTAKNPESLLKAALEYARLGLSVFPLFGNAGGRCACGKDDCNSPCKHPYGKFAPKGVYSATTDPRIIRGWFGNGEIINIAIATGRISGIVVLDVDGADGQQSLQAFTDKCGQLPVTTTVSTGKGHHYYFKHPGFDVKNSVGTLAAGLDIRSDRGYVVAPGSIHISGKEYKLITGFDVPFAPMPDWLCKAYFTEETEEREETEETEDCEDGEESEDSEAIIASLSSASSVKVIDFESLDVKAKNYVNTAIKCTLPNKKGYRNTLIFQFGRWLQGYPDFEKRGPGDFKPLVRIWYSRALPNIGTVIFDVTWADFCYGWSRVKWPKGSGALKIAVQRAVDMENRHTAENAYESPEIKLLVRLCFELQKLQGAEPFWLSWNDAAWILGVTSPTAGSYLAMLEIDRIIKLVKTNTATKSRRYKFIAS